MIVKHSVQKLCLRILNKLFAALALAGSLVGPGIADYARGSFGEIVQVNLVALCNQWPCA